MKKVWIAVGIIILVIVGGTITVKNMSIGNRYMSKSSSNNSDESKEINNNKSDSDESNDNNKNQENSTEEVLDVNKDIKDSESNNKNDTSLNNESSDKKDTSSNNASSDKNSTSSNNTSSNKKSNPINYNVKCPYSIPNESLEIEKIIKYSGEYLEDGSENKSKNIAAMIIKNTSKEFIQYAKLSFKVNNETYEFEFTSLESGKSIYVLEANAKQYNKNDKYVYKEAVVASIEKNSLMKDKIKLSATDGVIEVKNISSSKIDTVYVYYKQKVFNDNLPGSITYRVKLEDIKSGQSKATIANHFSTDDCEIIMVDTI